MEMLRVPRETCIQCVIHNPAAFQSRLVVGTDEPQPFANQVQSCGSQLDGNGLHRICLVDDSGDPVQDGIGQVMVRDDCMKRTVSVVVRKSHSRNVKWLCIVWQ